MFCPSLRLLEPCIAIQVKQGLHHFMTDLSRIIPGTCLLQLRWLLMIFAKTFGGPWCKITSNIFTPGKCFHRCSIVQKYFESSNISKVKHSSEGFQQCWWWWVGITSFSPFRLTLSKCNSCKNSSGSLTSEQWNMHLVVAFLPPPHLPTRFLWQL